MGRGQVTAAYLFLTEQPFRGWYRYSNARSTLTGPDKFNVLLGIDCLQNGPAYRNVVKWRFLDVHGQCHPLVGLAGHLRVKLGGTSVE